MQWLHRVAAAALILAPLATAATILDPALPRYEPRAVDVPRAAAYVTRDGAVRIVGTEVLDTVIEQLDARFAETHPGTRFAPALKGTSAAMVAGNAASPQMARMPSSTMRPRILCQPPE